MRARSNPLYYLFVVIFVLVAGLAVGAQGVKRIVVIKIDGLPGYYVDRFVKQRDPATGHSRLPWFDEVFYKNGSRMVNFYTRGMSLSGPSWGQLDTGQHLQIKGNVEYDRLTLHAYDYLNFFPYYMDYGLSKKVDMPAVEVMDQLKIPLLSDAFPIDRKYISQQLYQRGNDWAVVASGFVKLYPGTPDELIDEWNIGLPFRDMTINQNERDILGKVVKRDQFDYLDYYDVSFDHVSHHNSDVASRFMKLKELDQLIGNMWTAIQSSSRADETALVLISDHGFNSEENTYSQGFNLVKLLGRAEGGGHHVITKRRLMLDYSLMGIYPLVPLIRTSSNESYYLKGRSLDYPTALVDFDGNERSSIHLRETDLNTLQILIEQLQKEKLTPALRSAVTDAIFQVIDKHRQGWQETADQLGEEIDALERSLVPQQKRLLTLPLKADGVKVSRLEAENNRRFAAQITIAVEAIADYRKYLKTLTNLLELRPDGFDSRKLKITDYIAPGAMGDLNSVYGLQNYVVGLSGQGLTLDASQHLDMDRSFTRVNYFELFRAQSVRNNVQAKLSSRPIDFVAARVPLRAVTEALPPELKPDEDAVLLYGDADKQALLLTRQDESGDQSYFYLPVSGFRMDETGKVTFRTMVWAEGFPLRYFEDKNFAVEPAERAAWLSKWHPEIDWLHATHKTTYSNGIIGLNEQMDRHPVATGDDEDMSGDEKLIARLRQRQRHMTEADLLILANNHWNFDVRGFNPGGNHGSFFRVSTNSTFMIAGGPKTGIPRALEVDEPYDGLSFVPTILKLMGKVDDENRPIPELAQRGYRRFPGRVVREITGSATQNGN